MRTWSSGLGREGERRRFGETERALRSRDDGWWWWYEVFGSDSVSRSVHACWNSRLCWTSTGRAMRVCLAPAWWRRRDRAEGVGGWGDAVVVVMLEGLD